MRRHDGNWDTINDCAVKVNDHFFPFWVIYIPVIDRYINCHLTGDWSTAQMTVVKKTFRIGSITIERR